jgi:hypothetical protein
MGEACGLYGGKQKFIQGFGADTMYERGNLEDLGVNGRVFLKKYDWKASIGLIWLKI